MLRLLILGGTGMLGHKLWQIARAKFDVRATVRDADLTVYGFPKSENISGTEAADFDSILRAFDAAKPHVVVNCVGVVKQRESARDPITSIVLNALFPQRVAALARAAGARMIHVSTDCVFSGRRGMYTEDDVADAEDLYGRTKLLGEVSGEGLLTIRTSMIGRELRGAQGLVEWFLSHRGKKVDGYSRAIFSGLTTTRLAHVISEVIHSSPNLEGVWHVSADPISKFDLLRLINDAYGADAQIAESDSIVMNRSLDSSRFREATGFRPMPWSAMIREMAGDPTPYDEWRALP